jgi:hypothetical protein
MQFSRCGSLPSSSRSSRSPIPFYEKYGFVQAREIVFDDEVLLRLEL